MSNASVHDDDFENTSSEKTQRIKYRIFPFLLLILILIMALGILGYKYFFGGTWLRAFFDTAITVSTLDLGRERDVVTPGQQIFVAVLALLSGIIFLTFASYITSKMIKYYE